MKKNEKKVKMPSESFKEKNIEDISRIVFMKITKNTMIN